MENPFTLKGLTFRVELLDDTDVSAPWDEFDGHGPVRQMRSTDRKRPGERVMETDRGTAWLYDWQAACAIAKRDGWGLSDEHKAELRARLGRELTPGDIRAEAVRRDFEYCRGYIRRDWWWCAVEVTLLDTDGNVTSVRESLAGIESDAYDYQAETARELAGEIARRIGRRKFLQPVPAPRVRVRK